MDFPDRANDALDVSAEESNPKLINSKEEEEKSKLLPPQPQDNTPSQHVAAFDAVTDTNGITIFVPVRSNLAAPLESTAFNFTNDRVKQCELQDKAFADEIIENKTLKICQADGQSEIDIKEPDVHSNPCVEEYVAQDKQAVDSIERIQAAVRSPNQNNGQNKKSIDKKEVDMMAMDIDEEKSKYSDFDMMSVESFDFEASDQESDSTEMNEDNLRISNRFDADIVVQSIKRGESTLKKVEDKDCVLIIGKTGTGKSTLIQALAGKKFHESEHTYSYCNGQETDTITEIVYEAIDPLPDFEIGHEKKSKTVTIGCFDPDVSSSSTSSHESFVGKRNIVLVDTPGFEDTRGPEGDVATSVLLSQVASCCRSLRFVIMISYVSLLEDRGGSMRSILRLIRTFTSNFEDDKQSFMFLFTHTNKIRSVPDDIKGSLKCLLDEVVSTTEASISF